MDEPENPAGINSSNTVVTNNNKKTTSITALIIFIVISLSLGGFIVYDKVISDNDSLTNSSKSTIKVNNGTSNKADNTATTNDIQTVYEAARLALEDGSGIIDHSTVNIQAGEEGTVGGIVTLKAYKLDFSPIEQYFTDRAMQFIKFYFTDTPYGHKDGNYYIYTPEGDRSYDKKEFMNTIFGQTDQRKRDLSIIFSDNDTAVAVSKNSSGIKLDEYVIFKKIDEHWKIDMFEEF